jgi:hypothetical protein
VPTAVRDRGAQFELDDKGDDDSEIGQHQAGETDGAHQPRHRSTGGCGPG